MVNTVGMDRVFSSRGLGFGAGLRFCTKSSVIFILLFFVSGALNKMHYQLLEILD